MVALTRWLVGGSNVAYRHAERAQRSLNSCHEYVMAPSKRPSLYFLSEFTYTSLIYILISHVYTKAANTYVLVSKKAKKKKETKLGARSAFAVVT
mmetsp:Transcript_26356/g.67188  ORF Transcript_26356/g.67188 Transcript_26356/m.67188 type:complete len:95 (+) Transcript_26356:112-396(+)